MTRLARTAVRLADGSTAVARRLGERLAAWVARGRRDDLTGWRAALGPILRSIGLVLGLWLLWRLVRAVPNLMWLITGAWTIAAWRAGKPATDTEEQPTEAPTGEPEETPEDVPQHSPEEVYAATLEWICSQIADRNGIHLHDLLANAHHHGLHTDLDVPAFRAVLEGWGFPIRQQLKVGGRNRPGIHRDDLPQEAPPAPSPREAEKAATSATYPL